jgi:hypothetical protein
MPALVVPIIAEKDYRAFRKILRQYLPPRFESWAAENAAALRNAETLKADVRRQHVAPDAFSLWLQERNVPPDMSQLNAFAWEIAHSSA